MEIARLKAELAKARMERDILKKAAVYFARESRLLAGWYELLKSSG
jgi:transposase-like protein